MSGDRGRETMCEEEIWLVKCQADIRREARNSFTASRAKDSRLETGEMKKRNKLKEGEKMED